MSRKHLVIGTAGHIDHGKTSLVKALTGTDTDWLDEEKQRGITINLGFAFLGDNIAFVDVPGHERLIKNMVAGASAIRAALLVVAADDGVMPQTREHLAVINALGVTEGMVAITKADLVDEEWLDLVQEDVRELLESTSLKDSNIYVVDSISGKGIDELREALIQFADNISEVDDPGFLRMPVDRSFLIKGYGRVVTGSVWSGSAKAGDMLQILPGGYPVKVRGLQVHEQDTDAIYTGDRAAINLTCDEEPYRGEMLISKGRGFASDFIDLKISLLPDARTIVHRMRVRFHIGTYECIGRLLIVNGDMIAPGGQGYARIALEEKVAVMQGDRAVLRLYSPMETLGGALIIDPSPPDKRRTINGLPQRFDLLSGNDEEVLEGFVQSRVTIQYKTLVQILPWSKDKIKSVCASLVEKNKIIKITTNEDWYINPAYWNKWNSDSFKIVSDYHLEKPEESGIPRAALVTKLGDDIPDEIVPSLIKHMTESGKFKFESGTLALSDFAPSLRKTDVDNAEKILKILEASGINTPLPADIAKSTGLKEDEVRRLLRALKLTGKTVILDERVIITVGTLKSTIEKLRNKFPAGTEFKIAEVSELLDTSRKYIIPLMEYLDGQGLTSRAGDVRTFYPNI